MRAALLIVALCCAELASLMLAFLPVLFTDNPLIVLGSTFTGIVAAVWSGHAILERFL